MNIEELAKEAGIDLEFARGVNASDLRIFAKLIAEKCAGICSDMAKAHVQKWSDLAETDDDDVVHEAKANAWNIEQVAAVIRQEFGL